MADISKITTLDGTTYDVKDAYARRGIPYGVCNSSNASDIKSVSIPEVTELVAGLTVAVKFTYNNAMQSPQLKINDLDAKYIYATPTNKAYVDGETTGWSAGSIVHLTYDGEKWLFNKGYNTNNRYVVTSISCNSDGNSATKIGIYEDYYTLKTGNVFECTMRTSNYKQSALTFSIGGNSKPLYINGEPSSSTNYTLPAGKYLVYYDGTAYQFRTDGKQPIDIAGDSKTVNGHTVASDVPSNAVFTDHTYGLVSDMNNGLVPQTFNGSYAQPHFLMDNTAQHTATWEVPPNATTSYSGYMSAEDKTYLEGLKSINNRIIVIDIASFSSLPVTSYSDLITADHYLLNYYLSSPTAQSSDWTVTTSDGSVTISGTISGSTTAQLVLGLADNT